MLALKWVYDHTFGRNRKRRKDIQMGRLSKMILQNRYDTEQYLGKY
jgi:hypothetical protein